MLRKTADDLILKFFAVLYGSAVLLLRARRTT